MRISDWSSDVCSSDLAAFAAGRAGLDDRPVADDDGVVHGIAAAGGSTGKPRVMVGFVSANPDPVACGVATAVIHTPDDIYYCGAGMSVDMDIPSCRRCGIPAACAEIGRASWRERVCQYV